MVVVPAARPVARPDELPIMPLVVLVLLHVPPVVVLVSVVFEPTHTEPAPEMATGNGLQVTVIVLKQPVPSVYVMTPVPADTPVTTPVEASTETALPDVLYDPPLVAEDTVMVDPTHTVGADADNAAGKGFTVTVVVRRQPVGRLYVTTEVPAIRPFTVPVAEPTVATAVLLLLQVPPGVTSDNVVVVPMQREKLPAIVPGSGFTVSIADALQPVLVSV
jgi:hypothetical protein